MSDGRILGLEIDPDPVRDRDRDLEIGLIVWIDSGKIVDIDKIEMRIPIARGINPNRREVKVAVAVGIGMAKAQMNHRDDKREDAQVVIDTMETVIVTMIVIVIAVIEGKGIPDPGPIGTGVALAVAQVGNEIGIRVDIEKRIDKGILNVVIGTNHLGNEDAWKKVEVGAIETAGGTTIEIETHDNTTNLNLNPNHKMTEERTGSPQTFA